MSNMVETETETNPETNSQMLRILSSFQISTNVWTIDLQVKNGHMNKVKGLGK